MSDKNSNGKKILVVSVNWLGDVIFSSAVYKALHEHYPSSQVTVLAVPRVVPVLECISGVDEIIVYDERGKDRGILAKLRLIIKLFRKKFDIAFFLHGSFTRTLMVALSGVPVRVGYWTAKRSWLLTHPLPKLPQDTHKADLYMNVFIEFGVPVAEKVCQLSVPPKSIFEVNEKLLARGIDVDEPYILVHCAGNWDLKRWPAQNWSRLIQRLSSEVKQKIVIAQGPGDMALAKSIALESGVDVVVLAGEVDLKQLFALLARANVVISADSGPLHIASCVARDIVGLYGPTLPQSTGPRGKANKHILFHDVGCNRASCYYLDCPDNVCMKAIGVEEVVAQVKEIINGRKTEK